MEIKQAKALSSNYRERGFLTGAKAGNLYLFDYSLFVISPQEDEVAGSPSKGEVSWACNYWKYLAIIGRG